MSIFIPSVVLAHNPGGFVMSCGIMFFLSLIISLILLNRIRKRVTITNKFWRFMALLVIGIILLLGLTIILSYTLGVLVYTYVFGG